MKTVKLVDITVKEVPYLGYNELRYYTTPSDKITPFKEGALLCDEIIEDIERMKANRET